jgi:iron complex transport system ATP-binding protein
VGAQAQDADLRAARDAMLRLDVSHLAERSFPTLSGGEAHRVEMARVLAQDTPVLLVDEPTNHLDLRHQVDLLETLGSIAREGRLVIAVLHDLNLAARFADRILVLSAGAIVADGTPLEVMTGDLLEQVFDVPFDVARQANRPLLVPKLRPVREGAGPLDMSSTPGGRT